MHFDLTPTALVAHGKELLPRANQRENGVHVDVPLELDKAPSALPIAVISAAFTYGHPR